MKDTLFIYPHDEVKLPYDYHFSHNLAVRLYDDLVWILKDKATQNKINVKIQFKDNNKLQENEEDIIGWLLQNGYNKEVDEIVSKHLTFAIISDICHYVYQALNSSKNIKMTVAFTLIRKPFLENLLIIEQLLTDEKAFLDKFEKDATNFDPGKISVENKKELINKSLEKISTNYLLTSDIIYALRWDKDNENSIYANTNLATHLVTTRNSSYKTENQNLNMIFSGFDEWDSQLAYFYYFVPLLLFYMTEIIDQYLLEKKIITLKKFKERKFFRLLGQMLQHDQFDEKSLKGKTTINSLVKNLKVKCKNCNKVNQLYKSDLYYIVHEDYLLCKHCLSDLIYETDSLREMISKLIQK
ncbi:MAG: hypothetical protein AB7S69_16235 [Salinivirgaceae bacterium]